MSYLVLARKYRPSNFEAVAGQEHVIRTLKNAIAREKIAHAYLFAGPRGVGKTSTARILAKGLNCQRGPTPEPCLECVNCREIADGSSLAVREIDGASHNSVDNVRELIDTFRSLPAPGSKYKIYIIDEVHMLSTAAFNALLKSLEEPPPNTVFVLATTEAHKIPETVLSRVQRFDLRALTQQEIENQLKKIAMAEGIAHEDQAIRLIARVADGSLRDSQSLLDRVHSFCDGPLTVAETSKALGVVERRALHELSGAIFRHQSSQALETVDQVFGAGLDPTLFLHEFVEHWRDLLFIRFGSEDLISNLGLGADDLVELKRQVEGVENQDLQDLVRLAREGADLAVRSAYPRPVLESLVVQLAERKAVRDIQSVIDALGKGTSLAVASARASSSSKQITASQASVATTVTIDSSAPSAEPVATKPAPAAASELEGDLDWPTFVRSSSESKAPPMLMEQLKRLSVKKFGNGVLLVDAPEFSKSYLEQAANKAKFEELLVKHSGIKRWRVTLGLASESQAASGSLLHLERADRKRSQKERIDEIKNSAQIRSLQEHFPGSKIESVKIKE